MTERTFLGKRVSVELLKYFSAGHVASARLNVFGLRHHVAFEARCHSSAEICGSDNRLYCYVCYTCISLVLLKEISVSQLNNGF